MKTLYKMSDNKTVEIYHKNLDKYWECSYKTFKDKWEKNGWELKSPPPKMDKHLYLQDKRTGETEYILSFSDYIKISKGSVIQGTKFKMFVDNKLRFK